jgi:hypothetical protein
VCFDLDLGSIDFGGAEMRTRKSSLPVVIKLILVGAGNQKVRLIIVECCTTLQCMLARVSWTVYWVVRGR